MTMEKAIYPIHQHILEARQFTRKWLEEEFFPEVDYTADYDQQQIIFQPLKGSSICLLFYEPSTRTRMSFFQAATKLGANVFNTENAKDFSSAIKGESLIDTVRVVNVLGFDAMVIRYHLEGGAKEAAAASKIPVINAGDGTGEHPTQALLDIYTIYKHFGRIDELRVALVGDLKHGRTTRSLAYVLSMFNGVRLELVAPPELQMREDVLSFLQENHVSYHLSDNLTEVAPKVDVTYMTRAQKERMTKALEISSSGVCITDEVMERVPSKAIIMHPLPRSDDFGELPEKFTADPRVVIFEQVKNGLRTRMTILRMLLG